MKTIPALLSLLLIPMGHAADPEDGYPIPLQTLPLTLEQPLQVEPRPSPEPETETPGPSLAPSPSPAALPPQEMEHRDRGELSLGRQEIMGAREEFRQALRENPGDASLRERYAWFLYANGFHDRECLRLLEESIRQPQPENPVGLFNAIVEVRHELKLPATPLRKPAETAGTKRAKSGQAAPRSTGVAARSPGGQGKEKVAEPVAEERFRRWILTPYYSYSFFNHGRQGWQEEFAQLLYRVNRRLILGGEIDILERPPSGTNIYYSALASYYLWKNLEVHGKISICPNPTFAATQIYSGGTIWQALPRLGILLDYQHYNFIVGPIEQINPGIVWSFNDQSWLTLRYVRGWAFYDLEYNYYSAALNLGLPGNRLLTMAFAYGTDPDFDIGANGPNNTSLSPAYTYSLFFTQPITRDLKLFAGVQYIYRLQQNGGGELYQQLTPTLGCSLQF